MRRGSATLLVALAALLASSAAAGAAMPTVTGLSPRAATLAFSGGTIRLSAHVHGAGLCTITSRPALAGLPRHVGCEGALHTSIRLPVNRTVLPSRYTITVTAGHGSHAGHGRGTATVSGAAQIAAGSFHTCALTPAQHVYCWGSNEEGQLGLGHVTVGEPVTKPKLVPNLSHVRGVYAAESDTCVLTAAHTVLCWGENSEGQVGNGKPGGPVSKPTLVKHLSHVTQVATRGRSVCALTSNHRVSCWGEDAGDEIANGPSLNPVTTPRAITGLSSVREVTMGREGGCALLFAGTVKCWGANLSAELGLPASNELFAHPRTIAGVSHARTLDFGWWHICAGLTSGAVRCWGDDTYGQLGDGTFGIGNTRPKPVTVAGAAGLGAVQIAAGFGTTCVLLRSGKVKCLGENENGQVGTGSTASANVLSPTAAVGVAGAKQISQWEGHTCALLRTGRFMCWGENSAAELGNGKGAYPHDATPRPVIGLH